VPNGVPPNTLPFGALLPPPAHPALSTPATNSTAINVNTALRLCSFSETLRERVGRPLSSKPMVDAGQGSANSFILYNLRQIDAMGNHTKSGHQKHFLTAPKRFREPPSSASLRLSSRTPVPILVAFPRYRFVPRAGGNSLYAPAHSLPFAAYLRSADALCDRADDRGVGEPVCRHAHSSAQRLCRQLLLLLHGIPHQRRLRENV
jgi:hypothetical protein